jgi:drug/metabolite transporter (DMT)-like permease
MDAAIVLAAVAGAGWACNIVVVRWALVRTGAPALVGATVGVTVAAIVALLVAVLAGQSPPGTDDVWRFALVGAIAPGSSQGLFVAAIGSIGPSRTSVLIGTSPAWSVVLAILFLDESWRIPIVVGTLLTIAGGALISWEPGASARRLGVLLALATAVTFGVRDVVAREFSTDSDVSSWWAGAVVLSTAAAVLVIMVGVSERGALAAGVRRAVPEFLASGVLIGLALPVLLEALDRGEVSVVAPLSLASQNLTVVALSAAVFGANERTRRILVALVLIIIGATLVTAA